MKNEWVRSISILFLLLPGTALATDFSSTNFRVRDPVLEIGSSTVMSSTNFRLMGSIGQMSIGTSTSVTFEVRSGFLYYPKVTTPTVTATSGDGSVSLSWTASQGFLGWTVSGYNAGYATVSGGPYTYTSSLGNVLSTTISGLTNGTTYYFIVRPEDAFGNSIATSTEVSATPSGGEEETPAPSPSPGGGIILDLLKQFGYLEVPAPKITELRTPACPYPQTDLNCDGVVDLKDLSIYLYLSAEPASALIDFNTDKSADIADLSILFSDWTRGLLSFRPDKGAEEPKKEDAGTGFAFIAKSPLEEDFGEEPGERASMPSARSVISIISGLLEFLWGLFQNLFEFLTGLFTRA